MTTSPSTIEVEIQNLLTCLSEIKRLSSEKFAPDDVVAIRNKLKTVEAELEDIYFPGGEEHLLLKWGTLKSWEFTSDKGKKLLQEYFDLGSSYGAAQQKDSPRQKEITCELIDICDSPIQEDWGGTYMTKQEAKEYVQNYGQN